MQNDVETIADSLGGLTIAALKSCNPSHVEAPVSDLLRLTLSGLADIDRAGVVALNSTGLAVRAHLLTEVGNHER